MKTVALSFCKTHKIRVKRIGNKINIKQTKKKQKLQNIHHALVANSRIIVWEICGAVYSMNR